MSQSIKITLHTTVGGKGSDDPSESILQKIASIRQSVAKLRDDNIDFERIRDQYIIHLQQCQEDHNTLRSIYKKLKLKFDMSTSQTSANQEEQQATQVPQAKQETAVASIPQTRHISTIELVKITPSISVLSDGFRESSVRLKYALSTSSVICSVQFSTDGSKIAFADGNLLYIVRSIDSEILGTITLDPPSDPSSAHTRALKFSPDDKIIALSGTNNKVLVYDVETQSLLQTFNGHQKEVSSLIFNRDGSWLISGGFDGIIFVWDMKTHNQVKQLIHSNNTTDGTIVDISTTPDVPFYAIGFMNGQIGIYDELFEQPMMSFSGHSSVLMGLSVSPNDDAIGTVSQDKTVKVWSMRGIAMCKHTLKGHEDIVITISFSPKAPLLMTGSKDQTIRIWDQKTGICYCSIAAHKNTVFEIDHHPKTNSFVSCSGEGLVCVWEYDNPQ